MAGQGWTCGLPANPANVCTRADMLNAGSNYPPILVTVNVNSDAPASVTNIATVAGGGETNTGNDTASDVTPITINVGTQVSVSVVHQFTDPPSDLITVTNIGGTTIAGPIQVVLNGDALLASEITNATGLRNGKPYFTATLSPLAPGASVTFTVRFIPTSRGFDGNPSFTTTVFSGTF